MAKTLLVFDPRSNAPPSTAFVTLKLVNGRFVLAFDDTSAEDAIFEAIMPQVYGGGTLTAELYIFMASATSGDTDWDVSVEAVTPGDALDLDAADSFDTVNSTDNTTVPATAGFLQQITVTLTNKDSVAKGDQVRFKVTKDAVADTATGDAYLYKVEIREA